MFCASSSTLLWHPSAQCALGTVMPLGTAARPCSGHRVLPVGSAVAASAGGALGHTYTPLPILTPTPQLAARRATRDVGLGAFVLLFVVAVRPSPRLVSLKYVLPLLLSLTFPFQAYSASAFVAVASSSVDGLPFHLAGLAALMLSVWCPRFVVVSAAGPVVSRLQVSCASPWAFTPQPHSSRHHCIINADGVTSTLYRCWAFPTSRSAADGVTSTLYRCWAFSTLSASTRATVHRCAHTVRGSPRGSRAP